jgi:hypothetical protein
MRFCIGHSGTEQSEGPGIHNRCTGDMDCGLATFVTPRNDGAQTKSPAEIPRGFVLRFVKRSLRMIVSENRNTTFRDHALFLAGLAATYSSKP